MDGDGRARPGASPQRSVRDSHPDTPNHTRIHSPHRRPVTAPKQRPMLYFRENLPL